MIVKAVNRITLSVSLSLLIACGGSKKATDTGKACSNNAACPVGELCIGDGTKNTCQAAVPCASTCTQSNRQACENVPFKQPVCANLGCRTSDDCTNGQVCIAASCSAQPATAESCAITNQSRVLATGGAAVQVTAIGYDANGQPVPYLSLTSIAAEDTTIASVSGTTLTAGAAGGATKITATITGGKTCSATFTNLGANAAGTFRVYLYEASGADTNGAVGSTPVTGLAPTPASSSLQLFAPNGANLAANFTESATTPGVYTATAPPGTTFSFIGNTSYAPVTVIGVPASNELSLPLTHLSSGVDGKIAGFGGQPDLSKYAAKFTVATPISAVIASASIPPSALLSLDLALFTGDLGDLGASSDFGKGLIGGATACAVAPPVATTPAGHLALPRIIYLDNNGAPKGPSCYGYAARAIAGPRVAWSLGAQLNLGALLADPAIKPILAAATAPSGAGTSGITIGSVLPAVLPLLSSFASGVNAIPAGAPKQSIATLGAADSWSKYAYDTVTNALSSFTGFISSGFASKPVTTNGAYAQVNVSPGLPLGNVVTFTNPGLDLDPAPGANGAHFDIAGTLVLAQSPTFGLVPLGLGAGLDVIDATKPADQKFDSLNTADIKNYPADVIYARYSSPDTAVSDAEIIAVTVETNLGDLTAKACTAPNTPAGCANPISSAIRVRGNVTRSTTNKKLGWADDSPKVGSLTDAATNVQFVSYPAAPSYTYAAGRLTTPALTLGAGASADMVFMNISSTAGTLRVLIDPATISNNTAVSIPTTNIGGAGEAVTFTTVAIKFRNGRTFADLASQTSGIDFEKLAGDMNSIAAYSQVAAALKR